MRSACLFKVTFVLLVFVFNPTARLSEHSSHSTPLEPSPELVNKTVPSAHIRCLKCGLFSRIPDFSQSIFLINTLCRHAVSNFVEASFGALHNRGLSTFL